VPHRIAKLFTFEAAHHLPDHDGKCAREHGHSYRVEVTLTGRLEKDGPKRGMVYDFGDVASIWKAQLEPLLDHRNLNETLDVETTTAELIAQWIYNRARVLMGDVVERVRVWETASSWAEYPA